MSKWLRLTKAPFMQVIFHTSDPYDQDLWSDPVHFAFEGYDTSPFWDDGEDGRSYIVGSHAWKIQEMIKGFGLGLFSSCVSYSSSVLDGAHKPDGDCAC